MARLSLSLFPIERLLAGCVLLCCFAFKFVGVLLQSILVGRLGKAGRQTTSALGFGATFVRVFFRDRSWQCSMTGQRRLKRDVAKRVTGGK